MFSLSPFAPENLASRNRFGHSAPASAHSLFTPRLNLMLTRELLPFLLSAFRDDQPPSGQSRVYRVTRLRTNGVHRREPAGTRSVVQVSPSNGGAAYLGISPLDQLTYALPYFFPSRPTAGTTGMRWRGYVCMYVWTSHKADRASTGMVANPARGQLNRENNNFSLFTFASEDFVSRETGSVVPSRFSPLRSFSTPRLILMLTNTGSSPSQVSELFFFNYA